MAPKTSKGKARAKGKAKGKAMAMKASIRPRISGGHSCWLNEFIDAMKAAPPSPRGMATISATHPLGAHARLQQPDHALVACASRVVQGRVAPAIDRCRARPVTQEVRDDLGPTLRGRQVKRRAAVVVGIVETGALHQQSPDTVEIALAGGLGG